MFIYNFKNNAFINMIQLSYVPNSDFEWKFIFNKIL